MSACVSIGAVLITPDSPLASSGVAETIGRLYVGYFSRRPDADPVEVLMINRWGQTITYIVRKTDDDE